MAKARQKEVELHDAQLVNLSVDYRKSEVMINVLYFKDPVTDRNRVPATLRFKNVTSFSHIADLAQLKSNRSAGEVSNWWRNVDGKTYLYLAGGCMIVEAKSVKFEAADRN